MSFPSRINIQENKNVSKIRKFLTHFFMIYLED